MFDRPVLGWLPWAPGVSKKIFLTGNVLTIRWPLIAHIKKYMFENFFSKNKNFSKISLLKGYWLEIWYRSSI
jgi:hypothetical protein